MKIPIDRIFVKKEKHRELGDLAEQVQSIQALGLINPISVLSTGNSHYELIAGYHRLEACKLLEWTEIEARVYPPDTDPLILRLIQLDENLIRKNGSALQRCNWQAARKEVYEKLWPETKHVTERGGPGRGKKNNGHSGRCFAEDTARKTGKSARDIRREVHIATNIAPDVQEALWHTEVADIKTDLLALAHMDQEEQRAVADKIAKGEAKRVKEARRSIRRERVREKASALPQGLYNVVLADPPWEYDNTGVHGAAEAHYPTMSLQDICDLPETIGLQVADDAVLFLWATNPLLEDAFQVVEAWGFSYKTNLVWVKTDLKKPGAGWYVRGRHELCLICTRGSFTPLDERVSPPIGSVVEAPVRDHSRKPDELYQVIERLYPGCAYVELFARQEREGWTGWGTES